MRHTNKIYHVGTATVTRIDEMALPNGVPSSLYPDLDAGALEEYRRFLSSGSYDPKASTFTQSTSSRKPVELRASGSFLMRLKERRSVSLLISLKLPPDTSAGELQVFNGSSYNSKAQTTSLGEQLKWKHLINQVRARSLRTIP
jgi:hypothetical protein